MSKLLRCISLYLIVTGCSPGGASPDAAIPSVCEQETTGCRCGDPEVFQNTVDHCTATTVVRHAGTGFCCTSSYDCECKEVGCYVLPFGYCTCGPAAIASDPNAALVSACAPTSSAPTCCFDGSLCTCSTLACVDPSQQVASCSPESFVTCAVGDRMTSTCK